MPVSTTRSSRPSLRFRLIPAAVAAAIVAGSALPVAAIAATPADAGTASTATAAASRAADADATAALTEARALAKKADGKVDTVDLGVQIAQLDEPEALPEFVVAGFTDLLRTTTADVRTKLTTYEEKKAAEAAALAKANTREGAKATARAIAAEKYGWGDGQFSCLESLWQKESGWNYKSYNSSSGAGGIPQALPASKMASAGSNWKSSAATQIRWDLAYIDRAYGSPCAAWGHSQSTNWY